MLEIRRWGGLASATVAMLLAGTAEAVIIWEGVPSRGTSQFGPTGTGNCEAPSSITAATDPERGSIFRYHKPSETNRCENHGIRLTDGTKYRFQADTTYYLGWWSRLSTTVNNNANFQWKSYDNHVQNFPIVLKMIDGEMSLMQRQPQGNPTTIIWRRRISENQWNHYVLRLHLSQETRGGSIDFWFNGVQQTFNTGGTRFACRTLDNSAHNCPKWGVYGGSGTTMTNWLDEVKVGTTLADVMDGAPTPTPTPRVTPTPVPPRPTPTPTPTDGLIDITPPGSSVTASANDGNLPANTVDGSLSTRWSAMGVGQWIEYDLGSSRLVTHVGVAVYNGNGRSNDFALQVSNGGGTWQTVWSGRSSGSTTQEEIYDVTDASARFVRYLGNGNTENTWNSLTEVSIFTSGTTPTPTPSPSPTPTPAPTVPRDLTPGAGGVSASTNDGNLPANTVDDNLGTRWSAQGNGQWIQYDLGTTRSLTAVRLAWYQGDTRTSTFDVQVSASSSGPWNTVLSGRQSGGTLGLENHPLSASGRYVRIVGRGNSVNTWNSITEAEIWGF